MPLPAIGVSVFYMPSSDQPDELACDPLPAIITGIDGWMESTMSLTVFCRFGPPIAVQNVIYSADKEPGTWHWPAAAIARERAAIELSQGVAQGLSVLH